MNKTRSDITPPNQHSPNCLNSMWGKLGENPRKTQTLLNSDPRELYRFLATPGIEVPALLFAGDSCWISWRHSDEADAPSLRHTNEAIASFATAGARLHLYGYLDKLKEHALHCDTDSVIFVQPRDDVALVQTGNCLGAMTSELKPGEFICECHQQPEKLRVQIDQFCDGCGKNRL